MSAEPTVGNVEEDDIKPTSGKDLRPEELRRDPYDAPQALGPPRGGENAGSSENAIGISESELRALTSADAPESSRVLPEGTFIDPMGSSLWNKAAAWMHPEGFDANGKPGGPYSAEQPPPGKSFVGYLTGCTGIVWRDGA
jgi:hypothetical protein